MLIHTVKKPYLLLIGDMANPRNAKTAYGLREWVPAACLGQLRFNDRAVDLALPELSPEEARAAGAQTMVVGIAPPGGQLPSPEAMANSAAVAARYSLLKLKLSGEGDVERVSAVRKARPDAQLIVDANQSWTERQLFEFVPALAPLGVKLFEQPLQHRRSRWPTACCHGRAQSHSLRGQPNGAAAGVSMGMISPCT